MTKDPKAEAFTLIMEYADILSHAPTAENDARLEDWNRRVEEFAERQAKPQPDPEEE